MKRKESQKGTNEIGKKRNELKQFYANFSMMARLRKIQNPIRIHREILINSDYGCGSANLLKMKSRSILSGWNSNVFRPIRDREYLLALSSMATNMTLIIYCPVQRLNMM